MAGISFKIRGICLLLCSLPVVQLQAQRGGGRTPAERRSGAPLDPTAPQTSATQPATSTPGVIPPRPQPAGASTSGSAGGGQPSQPSQPPQFLPGRNPGFTPQPPGFRQPGQPGDAAADTNPDTGQPSNPSGQPAKASQTMTPGQSRPAVTKSAAIVRVPPVQPAPARPAVAAAAVTRPTANAPFIGPQLPSSAPLPPEKQAPAPPRITFQNGLLTLESTNSRLGDVLNGVRTKANIQFEGLDSAPERVAIKLGPAPADEVLASLLQGSRFDYVILGNPENPHSVERVLLSAKAGSPMGAVGSPPPIKPQQPAEEEEEATEEQTVEQPQPPVQNPQPSPAMLQQPDPSQGVSGVPTSEQLLEKLNRLKEEQQRQQNAGQGMIQQPNTTAPLKRPPLPQ